MIGLLAAWPCRSRRSAAARDDAPACGAARVNVDLGGGFRASNEPVLRFSDNRGGLCEVEDNLLVGQQPRRQRIVDASAQFWTVKFSGRLRLERRAALPGGPVPMGRRSSRFPLVAAV